MARRRSWLWSLAVVVFALLTSVQCRMGMSMGGGSKEEDYAWKEQLNEQKAWLMMQKQRMFWWKYYQLMYQKVPIYQLKQMNYETKYQVEALRQQNYNQKMAITRLQKEVNELKQQTELIKHANAMKKKKKAMKGH